MGQRLVPGGRSRLPCEITADMRPRGIQVDIRHAARLFVSHQRDILPVIAEIISPRIEYLLVTVYIEDIAVSLMAVSLMLFQLILRALRPYLGVRNPVAGRTGVIEGLHHVVALVGITPEMVVGIACPVVGARVIEHDPRIPVRLGHACKSLMLIVHVAGMIHERVDIVARKGVLPSPLVIETCGKHFPKFVIFREIRRVLRVIVHGSEIPVERRISVAVALGVRPVGNPDMPRPEQGLPAERPYEHIALVLQGIILRIGGVTLEREHRLALMGCVVVQAQHQFRIASVIFRNRGELRTVPLQHCV